MNSTKHVLVPRFADATNLNAQNLNAKSLLTRFRNPAAMWSMVHYDDAQPALSRLANVSLMHLLPRHLWMPHLVIWYQKHADAIFYPGIEWPDEWGLHLRELTGRKVPVISTMEALPGTVERERQLSEWAGHPVFCQRVDESVLQRVDYIYQASDHVIAISPFLARMGRKLYGDKFSVHMLGVDEAFVPGATPITSGAKRVVNIASFQSRKRPEVYFTLAEKFPDAEFDWFGEGVKRNEFIVEAERRGLRNLRFPGSRTPIELAIELRSAYLFAMPSNSEGVPKVTQEAAACGIPLVIYGYYESPTVLDRQNGFVVWSDEEFLQRVGELLSNPTLAKEMGAASLRMAGMWSWDALASDWEREIISKIASCPRERIST